MKLIDILEELTNETDKYAITDSSDFGIRYHHIYGYRTCNKDTGEYCHSEYHLREKALFRQDWNVKQINISKPLYKIGDRFLCLIDPIAGIDYIINGIGTITSISYDDNKKCLIYCVDVTDAYGNIILTTNKTERELKELDIIMSQS